MERLTRFVLCAGVMMTISSQWACSGGSAVNPDDAVESCEGFGDWQTSPYVLPYPVGAEFTVDQGNCAAPGSGHRGVAKYGYDFLMPIGSPVIAARGGTVVHVEESHFDGENAVTGQDNYVYVQQDDGTGALYGHFTHNGVAVDVGQVIAAGAAVGLSGNTGNTAGKPHLHISVSTCDPVVRGTAACPTIPFNFRNTDANPKGPEAGKSYRAR